MNTKFETGSAVTYTGLRFPDRTGQVATVFRVEGDGADVVFADGENLRVQQEALEPSANPASAPCVYGHGEAGDYHGEHSWIRLVVGSVLRPGTPYGCQNCSARATGAELAAAKGFVLLTKNGAPIQVHKVVRFDTTRGDLLGAVGTHREAVALINAVEDGPVLRRGEVIRAYGAAEWTFCGERGWRGGYAPSQGSRREEAALLLAAGAGVQAVAE